MLYLLKNAKIIQAKSEYNNSRKDILIKNGQIVKIADSIKEPKAQVIESKNLHVSPGWVDVGTVHGEPGFEHRESLESLSRCAASGGFTALAVFPNTKPVIDNKSSVQYLINKSKDQLVSLYPVGAISKACEGKEITEMIDMYHNGAIAFSDGQKSLQSSGLLLRALEYVKIMNGLVIHHSNDSGISNGNDIHEGQVSTSLGLKASPSLSEYLSVERDLHLNEYANSRLLLHNLTTSLSIEKLKAQNSKSVSASVSYLNLCKTDESIASFNVNYKVNPPLRSEEDRESLQKAVNKGIIDIICSNHVPLEEELKKKEFVYAEAGAIGLQTVFAALNTYASSISVNRIVKCLSSNPRSILGLDDAHIEVDANVDICIFDPELNWKLDEKTNQSKSRNSPFWNTELNGKVLGVIKGKQSYFNNY